jgi:hypothetical protein
MSVTGPFVELFGPKYQITAWQKPKNLAWLPSEGKGHTFESRGVRQFDASQQCLRPPSPYSANHFARHSFDRHVRVPGESARTLL